MLVILITQFSTSHIVHITISSKLPVTSQGFDYNSDFYIQFLSEFELNSKHASKAFAASFSCENVLNSCPDGPNTTARDIVHHVIANETQTTAQPYTYSG